MSIKYSFLCIFALCVLEIVQPTPLPYKKLSKEELNQIGLKCLEEVNLEKSVVDEVLRTQVLPHTNEKYKKFLACSYKKQRYLSPDGTKMLYDNIYEFLQSYYNIEDLEKLNHCKQIKEDDEGELCFQNLNCILTGLRKIEADNEIKSKNDVETNTI